MRGIARKANNPQNTAYQHTPKPRAVPKVFVNIQIHFRYKGYIFRSFLENGRTKAPGHLSRRFAVFCHYADDFLVGLAHADAAKAAEICDRVFHAFGDQSVAAVKLLAAAIHLKAQNARLDRHRDFGRAGGLGPVADNAGRDRQRVYDRVGNFPAAAAVQIRNAGARTSARADRAAVGREPADAGLFMERHKIRNKNRSK